MSDPGARPTFADRLADPLSHFPYKLDEALAAVGFGSDAEAEVYATEAYVAAQETYLREPTAGNRAAERAAADELQAVRRMRREAREHPRSVADRLAGDDLADVATQEG